MKRVNFKDNLDIRKDIEPLYLSAFPIEERPPEDMFFSHALKKDNKLYGYYENGEFIGFSNLLYFNDLCYLFFLAVTSNQRNKGYGSKIIQDIISDNKNKRIVLCYDEIDNKYLDNSIRIRRRDFYYRNGFKNNNLKTREYGVYYDTCYIGKKPITFEEYLSILVHCYGDTVKKIIKKA